MNPVIAWAIGIGSSIFALGLFSAIASRRRKEASERAKVEIDFKSSAHDGAASKRPSSDAMTMASRGSQNSAESQEIGLASSGSLTR